MLFSQQALRRQLSKLVRFNSTTATTISEKETLIKKLIKEQLKPLFFQVRDISGGCGASFEIYVASAQFEGKPMVKQHRMIYDILKTVTSDVHALRIHTRTPAQFENDKSAKE